MIDWQVIINKHGPAVWQTSYRLLGNHEDAADCFQETFVSALDFCRHNRVRNFSGLLARLATTRAIDQLRRRFRRSQSEADFEGYSTVKSEYPCPSQHAQQKELTAKLRKSLSELPQQEAQVFCLRYLNDMSYREIAHELDIKANTAGVLLHRARAKLRKSFELSVKE